MLFYYYDTLGTGAGQRESLRCLGLLLLIKFIETKIWGREQNELTRDDDEVG
jgi:hypothetical protein